MKQMFRRVGTLNYENVGTATRSLSMVVTGTNMKRLFTLNKNLMRVGFVTEPLDISVAGRDTKRRTIKLKGNDTTTLAHTDIDPSSTLVILLLLFFTLPLLRQCYKTFSETPKFY